MTEKPETSDADDKATAASELKDLAGRWDEAKSQFDALDAGGIVDQRSLWKDAIRRFAGNKLALASMIVLLTMVILAIVVPEVVDVQQVAGQFHYEEKDQGPSWEHPFGTDGFGRDLFVRSWVGARVSLAVAFGVSLAILIIGVIYGAIAGYVGGRVDNIMMRFLDALYGLPYLPFAIITVQIVRGWKPDANALLYMVPALSITSWFTSARIIRGQVMSLKENEYVIAARTAGSSPGRIVFRHLVPNTMGILVVSAFLEVPNAILGEAILSYLGLGVPLTQTNTSWGTLANEGTAAFGSHNTYLIGVTILIAITIVAALSFADGLRDALDPRGREN